ncbi:hypothetical protein RHO12_10295 [Orbus sturtevantii]|uniref:hypothetical protein n=1 Tax=Orbus sturtevantii TaxID=3074109 RepID=UPI00370D75F0
MDNINKNKVISRLLLIIGLIAVVGTLFFFDKNSIFSLALGVVLIIVAILSLCLHTVRKQEVKAKMDKFNLLMETLLIVCYFGFEGIFKVLAFFA